MTVHSEVLPVDEAAARWQQILRRAPSQEQLARATSRTIPVVRLVPV